MQTEPAAEPDLQKTEDGTLLTQIKRNIRESRRHFAEWRDDAKEDYAFFAGDQWADEDKQKLESEGRPAVVFNRVARTINAVIGLEVQNRQEARYFPREISDVGVNEVLTQAANWVRDNCDAEDEESEAFLDTLICGHGFTETRLDTQMDEDSQIIIERRDPFEMGVDHCAKKRNFDDKRYIYRIQKYSRDEFEEKWPDAEIPQSSLFSDETDAVLRQDSIDGYRQGDELDHDSRTIEVAQYQYFKLEKMRAMQDNGTITEMPEERFKLAKAALDERGVKYANKPREKRVYYQCFLTSSEILSNDPAPCNQFSFHAITGLRNRNHNTWFGLVRLMKDPQRWANKWLSQIQHILNTQAKQGKPIYETGAVKDPRKFKKDWAKPDAPMELNNGALAQNKFMVHQGSGYPEGIDRLLNYALLAVNDAPGVNMEMLGLANRDQPGVLEESRKQAGVTVLAVIFDSLRRYRKEQGRTLGSYIIEYISDGRLVRIVGQDGAKYVPLIKMDKALKYDVVVSDAPTSPNMKEKTWAALSMLLQPIMAAGIPIPPDLLDYTPLPLTLQEKWKKYISEQSQNPDAARQKQIAEATQVAEIESKNSTAQLNKAKAMREIAEMQKDPNAEINAQMQDKQFERELAVIDMQAKREEMLANLQLKREEMAANLQLRREELSANMEMKSHDMHMKHAVQRESNELSAKAAGKPSVVQQLGSDDAVVTMAAKLRESLESGNAELAKTLGDSLLQGLAMVGKSIESSNETLGETLDKALNREKVIIEKNGKAIGVKSK